MRVNSVLDYIAAHSPQGERRVQARIQAIIDLLLLYPGIGTCTNDPAILRMTALPYRYVIFYEATEAEIIIHAVRHAYDPARPFGPFLVAIANRRIIDRLRRQMRARSREIEFAPEHETFLPDQANLPSSFDDTVDERALHAAIGNLPPDQRQAISLLKLREMSLKEAAVASGRSVAALKVATHRAIKSLRKMLQPPSETP